MFSSNNSSSNENPKVLTKRSSTLFLNEHRNKNKVTYKNYIYKNKFRY